MKLVKLSAIFEIYNGNGFALNQQTIVENGVNFIGRSSNNLGITAKIKPPVSNVNPFSSGLLTVALGGSVLETFIQQKKFFTGCGMKILKAKVNLNYWQKIYYCLCIRSNAYKYSACGREATRTLKNLLIPTVESIPEWVNEIQLPIPLQKMLFIIKRRG